MRLLQGEIADEIRRTVEPNIVRLGEEPDEVYWEEAVRLAECKVDEQLVEEVSELDDVKAKYEGCDG